MIYLASFLFGGISGVVLWCYVSVFITCLQKDIYDAYIELFPENAPFFQPDASTIQQKKCGHILVYFFSVGFLFLFLHLILKNESLSLWAGVVLLMLWTMSYLDWHYQLISPTLCLALFALGVLGAYFYFSPLSLIESLQSSAGFFSVFGLIYGGAKVYYGKEVFGKGDWWLSLGIGSFIPLSHLPHFLLISCLLGIVFTLVYRRKSRFLPFAPFMCISAIVLFIVQIYT